VRIKTFKPKCWTGKQGYGVANRVGDAILTLGWLRYVASYDGWPERAAAYRSAK
jgi:hypothetical protein